MTLQEFQNDIRAGIPDRLPAAKPYDRQINHAPKRKEILTPEEQVLAIKNALRYFPAKHHALLAKEFAEELRKYGVADDLIKEFLRALDSCEFARFAPGDANQAMDKVYTASFDVISKMENSIKH